MTKGRTCKMFGEEKPIYHEHHEECGQKDCWDGTEIDEISWHPAHGA